MLEDILAVEYRDLPPEQIEQIFERTLGGVPPEDLEDFWGTLKDVGGAVSKALPQILPVAGTAVGTAFGGPVGGVLGGALGSAAGGAIGGAPDQRPSASPTQQPPGMAPSASTPMPGGSPAAAQLMQAMFRPEMLQALFAMLLGQAGRQNIPVGGTPVPPGAFTNLLSVLANRAAAEYNAVAPTRGGSLRYFQDYAGEAMGDPAVAEHRAEALWELMQEVGLEQRRFSTGSPRLEREDERELDDQLYDEMDLAELYSTHEF